MGCGDPISNQLFYEDALFVAALPGADRLAPPQVLLTSAVGDSELQQLAVEQSELLGDILNPLAASTDTLRTTPPDVRSDVFREWEAVPVVLDSGARWWVRGDVGRPDDEDGAASWRLDWAADSDGPWTPLAAGQHTSPTTGTFVYYVDDDGTTREIGARYGEEPTGESNLEVGVGFGPGNAELYWKVVGDSTLVWTGLLDVGLAAPRPSAAMVVQGLQGGRGEAFTIGEDPIVFANCWNVSGSVVFALAPDGSVDGSESACVVEALFE